MTTEGAPTTVADQLTALVDILAALLGQNLVGVYVANASPVDTRCLLVVTHRDLLRDRKYGLVQAFLRRSGQPALLELLVVRQADLAVEHPAVLVQLHYNEDLREHLATAVGSPAWLRWVDGPMGAVDRGTLLARLQGHHTVLGPPLARLTATEGAAPQPVGDAHGKPLPADGQQRLLG
jgi:hypothetical protein